MNSGQQAWVKCLNVWNCDRFDSHYMVEGNLNPEKHCISIRVGMWFVVCKGLWRNANSSKNTISVFELHTVHFCRNIPSFYLSLKTISHICTYNPLKFCTPPKELFVVFVCELDIFCVISYLLITNVQNNFTIFSASLHHFVTENLKLLQAG